MNVANLKPSPIHQEVFVRARKKFVPKDEGCYALVTFEGQVLYVGKTNDLNRRFIQHLDNQEKTSPTSEGRAFYFHWWICENISRIESTWLNDCVIADGKLPILNKLISNV